MLIEWQQNHIFMVTKLGGSRMHWALEELQATCQPI